jgi:hypothetical protein
MEGHVACMHGEDENCIQILIEKPEGKRQLKAWAKMGG